MGIKKKMHLVAFSFLLLLILFLYSTPVQATAYGEAQSSVDLSTLTINTTGTLTLTWIPSSYQADSGWNNTCLSGNTSLTPPYEMDMKTGSDAWSSTTDISREFSDANAQITASGHTDSDDLYGKATAYVNGGNQYSYMTTNNQHLGSFYLSGTGTFSAQVNYSWLQHLYATLNDEEAKAQSLVGLVFNDWGIPPYSSPVYYADTYYPYNSLNTPGNLDPSGNGIFNVSFDFDDTNQHMIEMDIIANAYAYAYSETYTPAATVAEPITMLLLGSGLIGLAGARRKMSK